MKDKLKPITIKYLKKVVVIGVTIVTILSLCFMKVSASDPASSTSSIDTSEFRATAYFQTLNRLSTEFLKSNIDEIEFAIDDTAVALLNPTIDYITNEEGVAAKLPVDESFQMIVTVPAKGLYHIGMMYRLASSFDDEPYIEIKVNGEIPFNEASELPLEVMW